MGDSSSWWRLLLFTALVVSGCASTATAPADLSWRPRFEAELARLDDRLDRLAERVEGGDGGAWEAPDPDDPDWVAAHVEVLAARDVVVSDAWTRVLADVPPLQRAPARQRLARRVLAVQRDNARRLEPLLDRHGWLTISDFGARADRAAWRVVQHADFDPTFQARVLLVLEGLVEVGETDPAHYAYLADRVAVAQGEPQPFGTQGGCAGDGSWQPLPVREPATLDERRARFGLPPLAEYAALAAEACP